MSNADMGCCARGLQDSGRLFLAGHRIAKASGKLVPVIALGLGEHSSARSEKAAHDFSSAGGTARRGERSHGSNRYGAPTLTVNDGSGSGQHAAGTILTVTAEPPPPGKKFAGWSGDTQILANPSESTTTATMPSIDVTITATYADVASGDQP